MAGESKTTTDHEVIRKWAEDRGGQPTVVKGTEKTGPGAGLLRFDFVGEGQQSNPSLQPLPWEEFFNTFEEKKLALLYQDTTREGKQSRFFKFVARR